MKNFSVLYSVSAIALVLLAGCGGGGDNNAGAPVALNVVPAEISITAEGSCYSGYVSEVFVNGGAGPYRIDVPFKDAIVVNKTQVNRGESFSVSFTGLCIDPGTVLIVDKNNQQVTLTLTNTLEEEDS